MILAISGSLRRASVNSAALRAPPAAGAPDGVAVTMTVVVGELSHIDPDLEGTPPDPVLRFRAACEAATGVLLAVPEYAFGIPGAFKNALDWTVGSTCLNRKPVTVLNVAPLGRGEAVRSALRLVMKALDADVVFRSVPVRAGDRDPSGEVVTPEIVERLQTIVVELALRSRSARPEALAG